MSPSASGKPESIKRRLAAYFAAAQPGAIDEAVWLDLLAKLAPVSESYLRELVRATGLPFAQPYAGVRQHSFEELERSLCELTAVYVAALEAGDRERARYCRRQAIAAKDRARFLAASARLPETKRAQKRVMVEGMLVWLENPGVFAAWVEARRKRM